MLEESIRQRRRMRGGLLLVGLVANHSSFIYLFILIVVFTLKLSFYSNRVLKKKEHLMVQSYDSKELLLKIFNLVHKTGKLKI